MKILVISHAHPDFSIGGAEIAAHNLFKAIASLEPSSRVTFLARSDLASIPRGGIVQKGVDEYLWHQDMGSWFYLQSAYPESIFTVFREFLLRISPDVIYMHHYAHMGVEVLMEIKKCLPDTKLVLTLHEYVAICNRNGQMLKAGSNKLCYRESIEECHMCFPEISEENFWLRKHYAKKHFSRVDHFVCPSNFLRQRYVNWGLDPNKITVIENGQPLAPDVLPTMTPHNRRTTIGFFGQVTEYKGLDILLKAIHQLTAEVRAGLTCEIHGANLQHQGQWLKDLIDELRLPLEKEGVVRWAGPYGREDALKRIRKVDWVVVPSIWWENSPMVIQEAFVCGVPVICSGIGGMAEKVKDGVDGIHFEVGNPFDLAEKLGFILSNPSYRAKLKANIRRPPSYRDAALAYLAL